MTSGTGGGAAVGGGGADDPKQAENSVLSQLAELFALISRQKRRSGSLPPTDFLRTLRERNELFRGNMQQVGGSGCGRRGWELTVSPGGGAWPW